MAGISFRARCCAAMVVVAASLAACEPSTPPAPPPIRVSVGDAPHEFPAGTTLGDVIRELSLRPDPGRLLSVSGDVLEPDAAPGTILLDQAIASPATPLSTGDRIAVIDGRDRVEGTRRSVRVLSGRHLGNPESTLRRYRIRRVTIEGKVSGDIVAVRDLPRGRGVTRREVALTFDDGPWPGQTRRILRILVRLRVTATFFVVGYLADRYPGIVREEARAGMRIGDHSWDHPTDPSLADLSTAKMAAEVGRTRRTLASMGVRATLFRPPGGSYDDGVVQQVRRDGMRLVTWSVDPRDWAPAITARRIERRVLDAVRPGSIVLLHDGGGDRSATIRALPRIVRGIRRMGFRLVGIPAHG